MTSLLSRARLGIRNFLGEARHELSTNGGASIPLDKRSVGVMIVSCVLLTLFFYYARPGYFNRHLAVPVTEFLGMQKSPYRSLLPYWYWSFSSTMLRVVIPLLCIVFWFKDSPREYGFRLWKKGHGKIYLGMYLFMLPLLVGVSFMSSFQKKYPFYSDAHRSIEHFVMYELAYGIQFAALEAFFRGFLIFALFKRFGYQAVVIMTIPYCMIHFSKPVPETLGAIVAGLALGFMALNSRSWLPGALLHWSVGFTMDILCIIHKVIIPKL